MPKPPKMLTYKCDNCKQVVVVDHRKSPGICPKCKHNLWELV